MSDETFSMNQQAAVETYRAAYLYHHGPEKVKNLQFSRKGSRVVVRYEDGHMNPSSYTANELVSMASALRSRNAYVPPPPPKPQPYWVTAPKNEGGFENRRQRKEIDPKKPVPVLVPSLNVIALFLDSKGYKGTYLSNYGRGLEFENGIKLEYVTEYENHRAGGQPRRLHSLTLKLQGEQGARYGHIRRAMKLHEGFNPGALESDTTPLTEEQANALLSKLEEITPIHEATLRNRAVIHQQEQAAEVRRRERENLLLNVAQKMCDNGVSYDKYRDTATISLAKVPTEQLADCMADLAGIISLYINPAP